MDNRARVVEALRLQRLGMERASPLYCRLVDGVVADVEAGGVSASVLTDPGADPIASAYVLAFFGGVHRIVLEGRAPELATFYASVGGTHDPDGADPVPAFLAVVAAHGEEVHHALTRPVQTNEVGRCAALLPGFLAATAATGLPLRTLEIGASAGLISRWDHYRYLGGADGTSWGDEASPLCFDDSYRDPRPDLTGTGVVAERRGCDRSPLDPRSPESQMTLRTFVWPDQVKRHAQLAAALQVAATVDVPIDQIDAGEWLEVHLAEPRPGAATMVFHSIVWQYFTDETKARVEAAIVGAGEVATADAPVGWLRFEPAADPMQGAEVRLRLWPTGEDRLLIRSGYHGRPVRAA